MPVIVPEPADTLFDPAADWKELLAEQQPGGGDVVSTERSEGFLVGHIPFRKKRDACKKILGYSWADAGSPYELHRVAPWRHPSMPWLWATSVRFAGDTPVRNDDDPDGQGWPKVEAAEPGYELTAYGSYNRANAGVGFGQLPFLVIDDEEANGELAEYERYFVQWAEVDPVLDTINAETGQIRWAEGPAVNQQIIQATSEYRLVTRYTARWVQVPENYIRTSDGVATKIDSCIGTVNNATLFGMEAGTLLFQAPKYRRYAQPVWTVDGQGLFAVDLELTWLHFSPVPGESSPLKRGWQLLPYTPGKAGTNGVAWYTAKRGEASGSPKYLWREADHLKIFEHVLAP